MSEEFDAYYKWLGIPPKDQPPNHYRLLGIELFEENPEVIEASAERQATYLHEVSAGPNVKESQLLLNKIAADLYSIIGVRYLCKLGREWNQCRMHPHLNTLHI
jgi:hypothetical protein